MQRQGQQHNISHINNETYFLINKQVGLYKSSLLTCILIRYKSYKMKVELPYIEHNSGWFLLNSCNIVNMQKLRHKICIIITQIPSHNAHFINFCSAVIFLV